MNDHHRLDPMRAVGPQRALDPIRLDPPAPIAFGKLDIQTEALGDDLPTRREHSAVEHQDAIPRRQRIG